MTRPMLGVIGAGAWGTALAQMLAHDGSDVLIWAREPEVVSAINTDHRNPLFLPNAGPCLSCLLYHFRRLSPTPSLRRGSRAARRPDGGASRRRSPAPRFSSRHRPRIT